MILDIQKASERRQSPRYDIDLGVDMVQPNGNILHVNISNISSSGLQIVCDTWATSQIEPRGIQSHSISHLKFKIVAELPINDTMIKLYAICRVMSVQRLSQDEYILSLAFLEFENGTENVLDKFLAQYQQKNIIHKGVVGE